MKNKIFMYLFMFAALLVIFQYVNSKSILDKYERDITDYKERIASFKDSVAAIQEKNLELMYFNLEHNDDAISYFDNKGLSTQDLIPFIKDELYKLNEVKGEHPIVPYASMTNGKMMINNVKLLNHKWILADFSDGKHWGEMFLTYIITQEQELKFKLVEYFMYPLQ